jgi:dihydropyrimidinase
VGVTSANAAQIFSMFPRKGCIRPGADADIVVWDGDAKRTISAKTHHHAVDVNIFEGQEVYGIATHTISRGVVVWENGELKTTKGAGKFVPRSVFGSVFDGLDDSDAARDESKRKVDRPAYSGPVFDPKTGKSQ